MNTSPVLGPIKRSNGVAGQYSLTVEVAHPGEEPVAITFVGSVYGGPVVMVLPGGSQVFVKDPDRLGSFGVQWVQRFFQPQE